MDTTDVGAHAEVTRLVSAADTASALGSGALPVLGTPRLLAWCEEATCHAVAALLAEGSSTVGTAVRLEHVAAGAVGARVAVRAELTAVDGRRLRFEVEARAAGGTVLARGTIERVVVDEQRFLARVAGERA